MLGMSWDFLSHIRDQATWVSISMDWFGGFHDIGRLGLISDSFASYFWCFPFELLACSSVSYSDELNDIVPLSHITNSFAFSSWPLSTPALSSSIIRFGRLHDIVPLDLLFQSFASRC